MRHTHTSRPVRSFLAPSRALGSRAFVLGLALAAALGASGCGNGGGGRGGNTAAGATGTVTLAWTAESRAEVASFSVDVTRFALRRSSGETIELVTVPMRVDLASLDGTARLLAAERIPAGTYARGEIEFDVEHADLRLAGAATATPVVASESTAAATTTALALQFAEPIVVTPGAPTALEVGVDLAASLLTVASGASFEPALEVRVNPATPRTQEIVGSLTSVDPVTGAALVRLRGSAGADAGALVARGGATTPWAIDGVPLLGPAAAAVLAPAPTGAPLRAFGRFDAVRGEFVVAAAEVGAGAMVATAIPASPSLVALPCVEGVVVARTGGAGSSALLEVVGNALAADGTNLLTGTSFLVRTSALDTRVARAGASTGLDVDAVVVGQRVRAHGVLAGTILDASGPRNALVLEPTTLLARVTSTPAPDVVVVDVRRVGALDAGTLSWSDGDATPVDPHALRVALPASSTLAIGTLVTLTGFAAPLGDVDADFRAVSLQPLDTALALAWIRNRLPSGATIAAIESAGTLVLTVSGTPGAGEAIELVRGAADPVALPVLPHPTWTHATDRGTFTLRDRSARTLRVFGSFAQLVSAVGSATVSGAHVVQVAVRGRYVRTTNSFDGPGGSIVVD